MKHNHHHQGKIIKIDDDNQSIRDKVFCYDFEWTKVHFRSFDET
jgi:hypothetical protein